MSKVVKFNTAYGDRKRQSFHVVGESLTQQSHAAEADVRNIIKMYDRTGLIKNVQKGIAQYGDYSEVNEYAEAHRKVAEANEAFSLIPSEIREQFSNNAGLFFEFATNPQNKEKMIEMGLAKAPEKAMEVAKKSDTEPPAPEETKE